MQKILIKKVLFIKELNKCINQVHNKDCLKFMEKLPRESIDLIIADPPYFEIVKEDWDHQWRNEDEYVEWSIRYIKECERILKPTGSFYIWGGVGNNDNYAFIKLILKIKEKTNLIRQNWITWKKQRGRGKKNYPFSREELLFYTKSKEYTWNVPYSTELNLPHLRAGKIDYSNGKRTVRTSDYKKANNVWTDISQVCSYRKQYHPTEKPELACDRIINASSNEWDVVFIPFAGSGSEIVSCINHKRQWMATEINNTYIEDIIKPRISKHLN